jgi:hypothetical protein
MEALSSSETSVLTRATLRNIPEDATLLSHRRENLKSYNFSFSSAEIIYRRLRLFSVGCSLWREDGSVIYSYNCYWASPALSLSDPSRAELETISYCLMWDWVPFLSPLTALRDTVEVFRPTSTRVNGSIRLRVTSLLTVGRSVCLGVEPRLWLMNCLTLMVLSYSGALSDEKSGLINGSVLRRLTSYTKSRRIK